MNKKLQIKSQNTVNSNGFTLIEITVSLSLFIVVMMISTGALLSLSAVNEKVSSMRIGMDNLNLALESMSREIRMGTVYHCDYNSGTITDLKDCLGGANSFTFRSQKGEQMVYQLNNGVIERSKDGSATTLSFDALTASEINIDYLTFIVLGSEGVASVVPDQPRVIISIGGTAGVKEKSTFKMQTMVTQKRPK